MQITETEQVVTVESLNAKIVELREQQRGLQLDLDRLAVRVANHAAQRRELLLSPNTAAMKNQVESIERAMADLEREEESLQLRIDALTGPIQAAEAQRASMLQKAAAEERRRVFEEKRAKAKKLGWNFQALVRRAKRQSFDISEFFRLEVENGGFTEAEKGIIQSDLREAADLGSDWNEAQLNPDHKVKAAEKIFVPRVVTIEPVAAPDELRHLEELR